MSILTMEDINFFAQQSSRDINMTLSGIIMLMNDTVNKANFIELQNWFQRMIISVSRKYTLTQEEIQQNYDELNGYMLEVIDELYDRNCIGHEVMMSLSIQLNELYINHDRLSPMIGGVVRKLNKEMDNLDNFHMLMKEIDQGIYDRTSSLVAICKIMSQFDKKLLSDGRKLDIIRRSLLARNILNENQFRLADHLRLVLEISMDDAGQVYLALGTIKKNFMANIFVEIMEKYYFLPDIARKLKNKDMILNEVIKEKGLDDSVALSVYDIYNDFLESKIDWKNNLMLENELLDEFEDEWFFEDVDVEDDVDFFDIEDEEIESLEEADD